MATGWCSATTHRLLVCLCWQGLVGQTGSVGTPGIAGDRVSWATISQSNRQEKKIHINPPQNFLSTPGLGFDSRTLVNPYTRASRVFHVSGTRLARTFRCTRRGLLASFVAGRHWISWSQWSKGTKGREGAAKCCAVVLYCTVLHRAVLCCAALRCIRLCCTLLWCTLLCYAALYCSVLYCAVLCCAVLCCAVLRCAALYSTVLRCAVLDCTVLRCTVLGCVRLCCVVLCCARGSFYR